MNIVTLVFVFMLNGLTYEAEIDFLSMEDCLAVSREMILSEMEMMPAICFISETQRRQIRGSAA